MPTTENHASVEVSNQSGRWHVTVDRNGEVTEQDFASQEEAEDFASAQRTAIGITPQPDLA